MAANNGASLCVRKPENGSGGPTMDTTSGKTASSVEKVRVSWSNNDFRGSTFVGDRHVSNTDLDGSADSVSDCFFLPPLLGVLLVARNNLLRRSLTEVASLSRGGLPVLFCCGSELGASGSVCALFSLPELSPFHSVPLSVS